MMNSTDTALKVVDIIDSDLAEHTVLWEGLDVETRATAKLRWISKIIGIIGG